MKRFVNSLILVVCLAVSGVACSEVEPGGGNTPYNPELLATTGHVTCDGQGVAGVVVTDGTYCTQTDSEGAYSLPYNAVATHTYISSPSGYTPPVVNSVPQYWHKTAGLEKRDNIDFTLIRTADDTKHYFIGVGDPQVRNATEVAKMKLIVDHLKARIAKLQTTLPVHLVVAGDVVFDTPEMHDASKALYSSLDQPVYNAIGNHDHVFNKSGSASAENDKTADSVFKRHYGPNYYSFNRGKVHYLVLDNIYYKGGSGKDYDIKFTDEQLNWVRKDLSFVSTDHAVVVVAHSPTKSRRNPAYGNSAELHKLLMDYAAVTIVTGHTHYNSVFAESSSKIEEHMVGAACGGFWEGPVCLDGVKLGYKVFEVDGTSFKWEYVAYADEQSQFSVFTPDAGRAPVLRPKAELIVNAWDWDSAWKVEWSADGSTFLDMQRLSFSTANNNAYDPVAWECFGTETDPHVSGRSWINATLTDHLFVATPAAEAHSATVRVTTRFGKVYTKNVSW